jgi:hypothetical protein
MGQFIVSESHVKFLIREVSKDNHELTEGDIDPKDRMNFRSMEKLMSQKVTEQLKLKIPESDGTRVYLEMARNVTEAFLDRSLTPQERIFMMWKAVFFYRLWRKWVVDHPTLKVNVNFLTNNCYLCVEINAHALILLTRFFRDNEQADLGT